MRIHAVSAVLVCFVMVACGDNGSSGTPPKTCGADADCDPGQGCHSGPNERYCAPLCVQSTACPQPQACEGAARRTDAQCQDVGIHGNGQGVCDLYNGSYGPSTCQSPPLPNPDVTLKGCEQCVETACISQFATCRADSGCGAYINCVFACPADPSVPTKVLASCGDACPTPAKGTASAEVVSQVFACLVASDGVGGACRAACPPVTVTVDQTTLAGGGGSTMAP